MLITADLEKKKKMLVGCPLPKVVVAPAPVSAAVGAVSVVFLDYPPGNHGLEVYNIQSRRRRGGKQHVRMSSL